MMDSPGLRQAIYAIPSVEPDNAFDPHSTLRSLSLVLAMAW